MSGFEITVNPRVIFGAGSFLKIPGIISALAKSVCIITGKDTSRGRALKKRIDETGIKSEVLSISGEPTLESVSQCQKNAKDMGADALIGIGGGSVIDTGKAVSALLANDGDITDYLEVVGKGLEIQNRPLAYIAVPTTSGTGSEATKNAVICSREQRVKASMRSSMMIPMIAVIDPELTYSMPGEITASTGLDALTQLIEPFVCSKANPFTDSLCREGMIRVGRSLLKAYNKPDEPSARENMCLASYFSGVCLANAGLGVVHGIASPLGGMIDAAHGMVCAAILPHAISVNLKALEKRSPDSTAVARYTEVARLISGNPQARAEDGIQWVTKICEIMKIKGLRMLGLKENEIEGLVRNVQESSSIKTNPVLLTEEEITEIIKKAL